MNTKRYLMIPGLIGALALLGFVGCSSDSDDDDSPGDTTQTPEPTSDPIPEETPEPSPTPTVAPALLEPVPWDNTTIYFVMTDRFFDGNPSNNNSYGRDVGSGKTCGAFHGGDLQGLTDKLNDGYFSRLGVSALWITAPYEQIHGWVVGGSSEYKYYAYHGYWALDFTLLDDNMGTKDELQTFVDTAHARGIRVIFDVVMNHAGYAAIQDLDELQVDVLLDGWEDATVSDYHSYIDYDSENFADWWGVDWIRAGLGGGYEEAGSDDLTMSLASLPDFKTESEEVVGLPPMYENKPDTEAVEIEGYTVRDYLILWLTTWVERYGIDGFRCDTAKHVEKEAWAELKVAANSALSTWREANPEKAFPSEEYPNPEEPFWMTGEVNPHGVSRDDYFDNGFDSLINFNFAGSASAALEDPSAIDTTYTSYASNINSDPTFNVLSYLSSHDTYLFFVHYADKNLEKQKVAGSLLLLSPGGVQIYYGDENARKGKDDCSDEDQATRTDYAWGANPEVLEHWQKLGQFRHLHEAIGAGEHLKIADSPYTFRRSKDDDVVYCVLGASGTSEIDVSADFSDGTVLKDYYTQSTATVSGGLVSFEADPSGAILIEQGE